MNRLKHFFAALFSRILRQLTARTPQDEILDLRRTNRRQADLLDDAARRESRMWADYVERSTELVEARQMAGAGPWLVHEARGKIDEPGAKLREANPIVSQGAYGDIELALQNVEWRREINLSWLEFSRWGIQQIILISRLYYIKNPLIRRLIDISAYYTFGRGVEVSSPDQAANEVLTDFFERNKKTLGQIALTDLERRKYYDGNLFFCFFPDTEDKGLVSVRTIDATEIQDIVCDPDDSDMPWFYRRTWTARIFNDTNGQVSTKSEEAWYPALGHEPENRIPQINGIQVVWDNPIHHRKCGGVAKWHFGCPLIYPALDWAREARRFLEACASVKQALSQIAMTLTTKGGQQALEGAKQQLGTTVGPSSALWDQNPPAVSGSIFASGPGTTLAAFDTKGGGGDPEEVRQYKLMCCIVVGVPETFLADVSTGNLATATTLDRPTELCFLEKQEAWREDLVTIARYVLSVSAKAPSGRLREAHTGVRIIEMARKYKPDGSFIYTSLSESGAIVKPGPKTIEVKCTFPSIREGDVPALVGAVVESMTLGNKAGQVVGIDAKAGVRRLYELNGFQDADERTEEQYPESEYDPDRTKQPDPVESIDPTTGLPKAPATPAKKPASAVKEATSRLIKALGLKEADGTPFVAGNPQ